MTREEQIKQMAKKYATTEETLAAIEGARWADENPTSTWISVNEMMPEEMRDVVAHDNSSRAIYLAYYVAGYWYAITGRLLGNITHWTPIPELTKETEI